MKNSVKMVLALTILGLISAVLLAFVYQWTLPLINEQQQKKEAAAVLAVLPGAVDYKMIKKSGNVFYEGLDENGVKVGVATKITGGGFQGMITVMVGTDPQVGKIYGIRVLEHQETPGLGANITGKDYDSNFLDKPFGKYKVVKKPVSNPYEVEAISGATISSTKVTRIVEKAVKNIQEVYGGASNAVNQ